MEPISITLIVVGVIGLGSLATSIATYNKTKKARKASGSEENELKVEQEVKSYKIQKPNGETIVAIIKRQTLDATFDQTLDQSHQTSLRETTSNKVAETIADGVSGAVNPGGLMNLANNAVDKLSTIVRDRQAANSNMQEKELEIKRIANSSENREISIGEDHYIIQEINGKEVLFRQIPTEQGILLQEIEIYSINDRHSANSNTEDLIEKPAKHRKKHKKKKVKKKDTETDNTDNPDHESTHHKHKKKVKKKKLKEKKQETKHSNEEEESVTLVDLTKSTESLNSPFKFPSTFANENYDEGDITLVSGADSGAL